MFMKELKEIDTIIDHGDSICVDVWSKKSDEELLIILERLNREKQYCIKAGRDLDEVKSSIRLVEAILRKRTLTMLGEMAENSGGVVIV